MREQPDGRLQPRLTQDLGPKRHSTVVWAILHCFPLAHPAVAIVIRRLVVTPCSQELVALAVAEREVQELDRGYVRSLVLVGT